MWNPNNEVRTISKRKMSLREKCTIINGFTKFFLLIQVFVILGVMLHNSLSAIYKFSYWSEEREQMLQICVEANKKLLNEYEKWVHGE